MSVQYFSLFVLSLLKTYNSHQKCRGRCYFLSLCSLFARSLAQCCKNHLSCLPEQAKPHQGGGKTAAIPPSPPPPPSDVARPNRQTTKRREKIKGGIKVKMSGEELWRQGNNVLRDYRSHGDAPLQRLRDVEMDSIGRPVSL